MAGKIFIHTPQLPWCTSMGCYPLVYLVIERDRSTSVLCADCATEEKHEGKSVTPDIYWEGDDISCEECNTLIPSAYGMTDEQKYEAENRDE